MTAPRDDAGVAAGTGIEHEFRLQPNDSTIRRVLSTIASWAVLLMRWAS